MKYMVCYTTAQCNLTQEGCKWPYMQVKVRFLSSVPPPVPLMLVKVAMLTFDRITALGRLPESGSVHALPAKPALNSAARPHREGDRKGESVGTIAGGRQYVHVYIQLLHFCKSIVEPP